MASTHSGQFDGGAALQQVKKQTAILGGAERLEKAIDALAEVTQRLDHLGDRLLGSRPQAVSADAPTPNQSTHMGRLDQCISMVGSISQTLREHADRLEQL